MIFFEASLCKMDFNLQVKEIVFALIHLQDDS